jgi:hypothetical protein
MNDMDNSSAMDMIGKVVLVGVTVRNRAEEVLREEQYYGTILRISEKDGLIIRRSDSGEEMWLPPALEWYKQAAPGEYRLRSTGQVVVNPDFLATFIRYQRETH